MNDIVDQLLDACELRTDPRVLEMLCGNARIEIERLRRDMSGALAELVVERHAMRALLAECAPHVFASAAAEHLLDGFKPQRRPLDDLAERVREALA